jgi:multidrug efflux pump subunit AcrA (membrane-fusion protein)
LRAEIQGKNKSVRPGEFVTVEMPAATMPDSWDVPLVAVVHEGDQAIVFVRTPEGFEARPVKVVARAGQRTRVQGSVKAGDQIAVAGLVALKGAWLNPKESE